MTNVTDRKKLAQMPWYPHYPRQIRSALENYNLPEVPLYRLLESSANYYPQSTAVVYEPANFIVSYADLYRLCGWFSAGLIHQFGVSKGDRVAIYSRNYPEFLIAMYGILMAGATYVACNPLLLKHEVEYQMSDAGCRLAIISDDHLPVLKEILKDNSTRLSQVIVFSRDAGLKAKYLGGISTPTEPPFYPFMETFCDSPFESPHIDPKSDLAAVIYTAGTTGQPKGVMVSHYNAVSSSILYYSAYTGKFPELAEDGTLICRNHKEDLTGHWEYPMRYGIDSALAAAPWTHMMGFIAHLNSSIMAAVTIFPLPDFKVDKFLDLIRKWKISFAGGAPQMMSMLLSMQDIDEQDLSSIRVWTTGGAPCPVAVGTAFEERIGGIITEGYSLTEAVMSSTKNPANRSAKRKWGSIGIPLPFTEVKIVDPETGTQEMPMGEDGELIHNGPQVAVGYLNRPEESRQTFKNGWVFTGDLARMDEEGYIFITGRLKDIIIYKGYNIAPRMLEEVIYQLPGVFQCAVVGKKDEVAGEIPVAFVSLKEGITITESEIMDFVNQRVAGYKKVRKVIILDQLPVSGFGKLMKGELKKLL
ncbi:MAG: long-chain acyl-CoA synthetase [Thermodesulfobacteriota bacterium]|nr:long-chain acyl-CoA synthetase [Thermodesulfobacteriota bacterium]